MQDEHARDVAQTTGDATQPPDGTDKLRRRITGEAARAVTTGSDARRAVFRAARRVARGWVPPDQLPGPDEVRGEVERRLDATAAAARLGGDRFDRIASLVSVLETVRQHPQKHPEGDALEHSLQVFDLVRVERPFDEELLTAALTHDVGKAIDRDQHAAAGIAALDGLITPRTRWLLEMLPAAQAHHEHRLGHRARHRLERHPDFDDVMLLADADRRARVRGYETPSLEEAIAVLRSLDGEEPTAAEMDG